jgi:hypothetical protein
LLFETKIEFFRLVEKFGEFTSWMLFWVSKSIDVIDFDSLVSSFVDDYSADGSLTHYVNLSANSQGGIP